MMDIQIAEILGTEYLDIRLIDKEKKKYYSGRIENKEDEITTNELQQKLYPIVERLRLLNKQKDSIKTLTADNEHSAEEIKKLEAKLTAAGATKSTKPVKKDPILSQHRREILNRIDFLQKKIDTGRANIRKEVLTGDPNTYFKKAK